MRRLFLVPVYALLFLLASCGGNSTSTAPNGGGGSGGAVVLNSIQISPNAAFIAPGTTQAFTATGSYSDGSSKDLTTSVEWACLLPNVATISSTAPTQGVATALPATTGTPTTVLISATSGSISNSAQLTVEPSTALTVTPATATIGFGEQQQFTATATLSNGSTQNVTNAATWTSTAGFISSNSGLAIGQKLTSSTVTNNITAKLGSQTANATLTVGLSDLASTPSILPAAPMVPSQTQTTFSVIGTFNDGSTRDLTSLASGWSSSDTSVATRSSGSVFTTLFFGSATISASINLPANGTVTPPPLTPSLATLTVDSATLTSLSLSPSNASNNNIAFTTELDLIGSGTFSDGSVLVLPNLSWSSKNPFIASVDASSGVVTGLTPGAATIDALSSSGIKSSTIVNVSSATLQSITIAPATALLIPGGTLQYSAIGTFSDGSTQDVSGLATFESASVEVACFLSPTSSSCPSAQTIPGHQAIAEGLGSTTITATIGAISGSGNLLVISPSQLSLAVSPASASVATGATTQLMATGTYAGTTQDFTTLVEWSSSAPTAATVGYQTGLVSGLTATAPSAPVTVTATLGTVSATSQVTVQ